MRTNPTTEKLRASNIDTVAKILADKAAGVDMNTPGEAIERAVVIIRIMIESVCTGVTSGLLGEPTSEDLQRIHELRSLLDDLP